MIKTESNNTTSRRALLAGAPAVAAAALAGGAVADCDAIADPIFAVIERHRKALDLEHAVHKHFLAMDALYPREDQPEEWPEWSTAQRTAWRDEEIARCEGNPRDLAYHRWSDQCDAVGAISAEIVDTGPVSTGGIAAVLAHWAAIADEDTVDRDFEATTRLMENVAETLRGMIAEAQS
jgi:hypothetical protein